MANGMRLASESPPGDKEWKLLFLRPYAPRLSLQQHKLGEHQTGEKCMVGASGFW